ncbi:MAG: FkbM family methyltransferase [Roseivirga sp.]|nr:FkbM family methyltransferase [Roseivirga sp.]
MSKTKSSFSKTKFLYRAYKYRFRDDVDELKYIVRSIKEGDLALDVGAHKGGYLHWIRKAAGTTGKVVAFEPQPSLYEYLNNMISTYRLNNITLHHAGLSSKEGELRLFVPKAEGLTSPGATFEHRQDTSKGHSISVPVLQLDKTLKDRKGPVRFIKMDVEGHELEVFKGGENILKQDRPRLIFECENRHLNNLTVEDVFAYLKGLGYKGFFFWKGELRPVDQFEAKQHQALAGSEIVDKKAYANNFVFEPINS